MKLRKAMLWMLVFAVLALCGCQQIPAQADTSEAVGTSETSEAASEAASAADTVKYRFPQNFQWVIGIDSYEVMSKHLDTKQSPLLDLDARFGTAYIEGNYLCLLANESQKQAVIETATRLLPQCCAVYNGVSPANYVEWSDDFSSVTYGFDYSVLMDDHSTIGMLWDLSISVIIDTIVQCNRILLTGDESVPIMVIHKNPETGYLMDSALYPYESFSMTDADWRKSASEDVFVHVGAENEIYMKIELREIDPDRLVFAPLEKNSYFSDKALLAVSRFNEEGEEIYIPLDLEPGDVVYIRVDGTYIDSDSDIPVVKFSGMIPERYFSLKG